MVQEKEEELLGDQTERVLKELGADKVAKAFEEITGRDCGCAKRKQLLNKFHIWWKGFITKRR